MLSTSILSKPRGPNELFTMFDIDRAAVTFGLYFHLAKHPYMIARPREATNHFDRESLDQIRDLLP
jgi:hypothetical protein